MTGRSAQLVAVRGPSGGRQGAVRGPSGGPVATHLHKLAHDSHDAVSCDKCANYFIRPDVV